MVLPPIGRADSASFLDQSLGTVNQNQWITFTLLPLPYAFPRWWRGIREWEPGNERAEGVWVTGEVRALTKAGNGTEKESARNSKSVNSKSLIWSFA